MLSSVFNVFARLPVTTGSSPSWYFVWLLLCFPLFCFIAGAAVGGVANHSKVWRLGTPVSTFLINSPYLTWTSAIHKWKKIPCHFSLCSVRPPVLLAPPSSCLNSGPVPAAVPHCLDLWFIIFSLFFPWALEPFLHFVFSSRDLVPGLCIVTFIQYMPLLWGPTKPSVPDNCTRVLVYERLCVCAYVRFFCWESIHVSQMYWVCGEYSMYVYFCCCTKTSPWTDW